MVERSHHGIRIKSFCSAGNYGQLLLRARGGNFTRELKVFLPGIPRSHNGQAPILKSSLVAHSIEKRWCGVLQVRLITDWVSGITPAQYPKTAIDPAFGK